MMLWFMLLMAVVVVPAAVNGHIADGDDHDEMAIMDCGGAACPTYNLLKHTPVSRKLSLLLALLLSHTLSQILPPTPSPSISPYVK
jgi:hypothetical protein